MTDQYCKNIDEYRICVDQASRLETYIWTTATLFGIGSIVSLINLVKDLNTFNNYWVINLCISVFAINIQLIWWRFFRRWKQIQELKFVRIDEIEKEIGFKQNRMISHFDSLAMRIKLKEPCYKKIFTNITEPIITEKDYCALDDNTKKILKNYQYKGIVPMCKLLVYTNVLLWSIFAIYSVCIGLNIKISTTNVPPFLILIIVFAVLVVDLAMWQKS